MGVAIILTVLLPIICGEYQELQLISKLTEYFHFDHHLFLLNSAVDANQFISPDGLVPQTVIVWEVVDDVVALNPKSKNCFTIVASKTIELKHTIKLLKVVKAMQIRQKRMKIGIFFTQKALAEDLLTLFEWCKDNQLTDIFAATYVLPRESERCTSHQCLLNIFTFHPFAPVSELLNVTNSDKLDDYFQSTQANFHRTKLRYGGAMENILNGNVWFNVFCLMNASLTFVEYDYDTSQEALSNGVDVLEEMYVQGQNDRDVYPVKFSKYVLLVPASMPYSEFSAYLRNGLSDVFFIYSILLTLSSILALVALRYNKQKRIVILQSAADVFNVLLNDNGYIKYGQLCRAEVFIIVPLTFVGFVIVNGILSGFQSHLTRPLLQPQINTADDIYRTKVPIITHTSTWKTAIVEILTGQSKYSYIDWDERVVDSDEGVDFLQLYNRTNAYLLGSDVADILLRAQKDLNINGYHQSQIETSFVMFTYVVHKRFLFIERLNEILLQFKSSGLYDLWKRQTSAERGRIVLKYNLLRLQHQGTEFVKVEKLSEFPMFIVYGWLAGFIVFIFEVIWTKVRPKQKLSIDVM